LYEKTQQQTGNTVVDKHGKSDAEFENSAGGFKQKSLNFKSSNPLLFKIILYAIIAVVGIFLLKIILSWIASIAIYLIVIAVLGIAIYIGVKIYKIKSEDK
jgi:ABC-type multidrug transport system fused ATPase/permease subunit